MLLVIKGIELVLLPIMLRVPPSLTKIGILLCRASLSRRFRPPNPLIPTGSPAPRLAFPFPFSGAPSTPPPASPSSAQFLYFSSHHHALSLFHLTPEQPFLS